MAIVQFKGREYPTLGDLPTVGQDLPQFSAVDRSFREVGWEEYRQKMLVFNIFPSIDTPTCSASVKKFNEMAATLPDVSVLCVSADLPFAQQRFCDSFSLNNVFTLSTFRGDFGRAFGVEIAKGPMQGLMSRAVVVVDTFGKVVHTQQVTDLLNAAVDYSAVRQVLIEPYRLG